MSTQQGLALLDASRLDAAALDASALDDPVTLWLLNHRRHNTRRAYARALRDFATWLARERGKCDVTAVTFADALLYREALSAREPRLRASSIIATIHALSSFAAHLVAMGRASVNPWTSVELPDTSDRKPQRAWRTDEMYAFFSAIPLPARARSASTALQYARDHALFWLLFRNGLRIDEACGARLGDLERIEDVWALHIREHGARDQHVKRGNERVTALKSETVATLFAYLERRGVTSGDVISGERAWAELPLFADAKRSGCARDTTRDTTRETTDMPALSARQVRRLMRRYGERAGLDATLLHPHAARRTAITTLAWRETSVAALKAFSGHRTVRSVEVYIDAAHHVRDNPSLRMPY